MPAKKLFGTSTEATRQIEGQMGLFQDIQELAHQLETEQKKSAVRVHTRTARKPGVQEEMLEGLPKEIEEYVIPAEETCGLCGAPLEIIGKRIIRTEVEFQPAKLIVKQIVQQVAKCTRCGTEGSEHPDCHFQKAAVPVTPLSHSLSTPSLVAQIMYQKFVMGVPFARQEREWYRMGLVLHMNETRIQCNKEKDRKAGSQSFMWVMRSAADEVFPTDTCHLSCPVDEIMPQRVNSEIGNLIHKIGTIFLGVKSVYFIRVIGNVNVSITICCQC